MRRSEPQPTWLCGRQCLPLTTGKAAGVEGLPGISGTPTRRKLAMVMSTVGSEQVRVIGLSMRAGKTAVFGEGRGCEV